MPVKKKTISIDDKEYREEFERLASSSYDRLYRSALYFTGNIEDASDIVQDTFFTAYRSFGNYRGESKFFTWLYGIFRNLLFKHRRSKKSYINRFGSLEEGLISDDLLSSRETPENLLTGKEKINELYESLNKLPMKYKDILILRHFENFSYQDISGILGCRPGTVKSRIHKARILLRKHMEQL
ncbi:MAG: sigma-70 family RNA polymerase sigma factor [bacterium]|nr:sigma-70 family RNA polymerase sigma factor [bacterium]